jgi:accessory colonization factor AcfC
METQDLNLLAKFADIVEELTTQELDEAWAILQSHSKAISTQKIRTLHVGQPVMFRTRNRGDKYGTIEKVMRKRVKVRVTIDDHGFHTRYSNGELWTVQAAYIIPLED